jgi:hypothetical protein
LAARVHDQSRGIAIQFDGAGARLITLFADYTVQARASNYFGQSVQAEVKIGF